MRVNVYAEEITDRIEIITKSINGAEFTGLRFYLELPVSLPDGTSLQGRFMHGPDDDETAMQLHVPVADHINCHPNCLHLWRPLDAEIPMPPALMVGPTPATPTERENGA